MELLTVHEHCKKHGIALTGGIATGKSTVAKILASLGEIVIDADQLSRDVTAPGSVGLEKIRRAFGDSSVTPQGLLDRKILRDKIFADPEARKLLEAITHPLIQEALGERLAQAFKATTPKRFFYEAALIFEAKRDHLFREVWATFCPKDVQVQRLMRRDLIDEREAHAILGSQWSASEKARKAHRKIDTDVPPQVLIEKVRALVENLTHDTMEPAHD